MGQKEKAIARIQRYLRTPAEPSTPALSKEDEEIRLIVLHEDRGAAREWWRCMGCQCYIYSEAHKKGCEHAAVVPPKSAAGRVGDECDGGAGANAPPSSGGMTASLSAEPSVTAPRRVQNAVVWILVWT